MLKCCFTLEPPSICRLAHTESDTQRSIGHIRISYFRSKKQPNQTENVAEINLAVDFRSFNSNFFHRLFSNIMNRAAMLSARLILDCCWHLSVVFINILSFHFGLATEIYFGHFASDLYCFVTAPH